MANAELRKYLGYVLEAERSVLILKKAVSKMNGRIQMLGVEKDIPLPKKTKLSMNAESNVVAFALGFAIFGAIAGWVYGAINAERGWFIFKLLYAKFSYILLGVGLALIPIVIFAIIAKIKHKSRDKKKMREYRNKKANEHSRAIGELSTKNNALNYLNKTKEQLASTQQVLSKLYSLNIIHPEFRNIVAVSSFYQYVDTGMCDKLEGHEGAYTLYLHESWYRTLSSQIENIIDRLDQIQSNQFVLYRAVKSANEKIDRLARTSEMTLTYAKATARNSEIIA